MTPFSYHLFAVLTCGTLPPMTDFSVRLPIYWRGVEKTGGIFVCEGCEDPNRCKEATVCQRATPAAWEHDARLRDEQGRKALDD